MYKVLVVEDEFHIRQIIKDYFSLKEIEVIEASQGYEALSMMDDTVDLILLDINLPFYDGFYWCTQIRNTSQVPLIFISSRNDDHDKIRAILQGGDDYVDKPFHLELLKAKIEAILRRTYQYKVKDQMRINADIYYDKTKGSLFYHEHEIHLTKSESQIVCLLLESQGAIVTRQALMEALWNTDEFVTDATLSVHISRLRNKLKELTMEKILLRRKRE